MKFRKSLYFLVISSALSTPVIAEQVNVDYSATITSIYDPSGIISNVTVGQQINGSYKIDTSTPDSDPAFGASMYIHSPVDESMVVNVGGMKFSSSAVDAVGLEVHIQDEAWAPNDESYFALSWAPMTNGDITIDNASINLYGVAGGALDNELLTAQVPDPQKFDLMRNVFISGSKNGEWFSIEASLDLLQSSAPPVVDPVPPPARQGQYVYKIVAQVSDIWQDATTTVATDHVWYGDTLELFYTIDTNVPGVADIGSPDIITNFDHPARVGAIEVKVNNWSASSDKIVSMTFVDTAYVQSSFHVSSESNITSTNSLMEVGLISVSFMSSLGDLLYTDGSQMVTDPTLLNSFPEKNIWLSGKDGMWSVSAKMVSVELVSKGAIQVVPSDSYIHNMQRFDAAIYVEGLAPIAEISGLLNGVDVSSYLQSCVILSYMESDSVTICPDVHQLLTPGENKLELNFGLSDLSTESTSVNWTLQ